MGAWSVEPFGNDEAADWAWSLDDAMTWAAVREALEAAADPASEDEAQMIGVAAAEVVAHGAGRPTQDDVYTESVSSFVSRVGPPPPDVRELALGILETVASIDGTLRSSWEEGDVSGWLTAIADIRRAIEKVEPPG